MNRLPPFPQVLLAGALAALFTSVLIWLLTLTGAFAALGIPIAAPPSPLSWGVQRVLWGALAGIVFLAPLLQETAQWKRGLLVAVVPILVLLLVVYPQGHEGWLGLGLGYTLLAAVVIFWLLWGLVAGGLLARWRSAAAEEELPDEAA